MYVYVLNWLIYINNLLEFTDKAPEIARGRKIPNIKEKDTKLTLSSIIYDWNNACVYMPFFHYSNDYDYNEVDAPTIRQLCDDGILQECQEPRHILLDVSQEDRWYFTRNKKPRILTIQRFFKENGFDVSLDSIIFACSKWESTAFSGYRDEKNNCHIHTNSNYSGSNLTMLVSELCPGCEEWQCTHIKHKKVEANEESYNEILFSLPYL